MNGARKFWEKFSQSRHKGLFNMKKSDVIDNYVEEDGQTIRSFIHDQVKMPNLFNATISKHDEMYLFLLNFFRGNRELASLEYLKTGKQMMDVIRQIVQWKFKGFDKVSTFLDFAGGYGRFTRFLTQELPAEHIWICDIYEDAIKFQVEQFGVHGIVSSHNPEDFKDTKKYDCVFVASLFSHLPDKTFRSWLQKLYDLLIPGGLLLFSVHDVAVLPPNLTMNAEEILFVAESESRSLDKHDYGTTYVSESYVRNVIKEITGKTRYYRMKRGLWWFQDIYIISKDSRADFEGLNISPGPLGYIDSCFLSDTGDIYFNGWAAELNQATWITDIQILANGKIVQHCLPSHDRPDIEKAFQDRRNLKSGFSCHVRQNLIKPADIVMLKIINSRNIENLIPVGALNSLLTPLKASSSQ